MVTTTTSDESDGYFGVRWDSPTPKPLQNLSLASFRTLIPWPVCTKRSTTSCFWGRKLCKVTELRMSIHWRVGMFYVFPIWWEYVLHTEVVSYPKQDVWNWYVDLCPCHFSGGRIGKATTKHAQVATGFFCWFSRKRSCGCVIGEEHDWRSNYGFPLWVKHDPM